MAMNQGDPDMFQSLAMFLATDSAPGQATPHSPPAVASAAPGRNRRIRRDWRFAAGVAGNAVGFAALLAGCWLALTVAQVLVTA